MQTRRSDAPTPDPRFRPPPTAHLPEHCRYPSIAGETEIGQGYPEEEASDGQNFCDVRRGGGHTRAAVPLVSRDRRSTG